MEFRLTYDGPLRATQKDPVNGQVDARAAHKQDIRRRFHVQLKRLWQVNPYLQHGYPVTFDWQSSSNPKSGTSYHTSIAEWVAEMHKSRGYRFVPLVRSDLGLICRLEILFLRPEAPGSVLSSGDIDNRLKTLFDALRMPKGAQELTAYDQPADGEDPFFCLLEDDGLITHVSVETDVLLEPVAQRFDPSDARLVINVRLRPYNISPANESFA